VKVKIQKILLILSKKMNSQPIHKAPKTILSENGYGVDEARPSIKIVSRRVE
jgi:hypothetical protein